MSTNWLSEIRNDLGNVSLAIEYYEQEWIESRYNISLKGNLEKSTRDMPGIVEERFSQLQDMESILEYLNIELRRVRGAKYRQYFEHYNKVLSSREEEKFADADLDVLAMCHIVNEFAVVRNKFMGIIKALEQKSFSINSIVKLRAAGLEDVSL